MLISLTHFTVCLSLAFKVAIGYCWLIHQIYLPPPFILLSYATAVCVSVCCSRHHNTGIIRRKLFEYNHSYAQ